MGEVVDVQVRRRRWQKCIAAVLPRIVSRTGVVKRKFSIHLGSLRSTVRHAFVRWKQLAQPVHDPIDVRRSMMGVHDEAKPPLADRNCRKGDRIDVNAVGAQS